MELDELETLKGTVELKAETTPAQPSSRLSALLSLAALRNSIKPWSDFFGPSTFARPGSDVVTRVKGNLGNYQGNYAVMCCLVLTLYLLSSPLLTLLVLALAVGWAKVMEAELGVMGKQATKVQKKWAMTGLAALAVYYIGSEIVFAAIGLSLSLILLHAACHKEPEAAFQI